MQIRVVPKSKVEPIEAAELRRLSVEASCDPRTIRAVLTGRRVRGLAGERARAVLVKAGFEVPEQVR